MNGGQHDKQRNYPLLKKKTLLGFTYLGPYNWRAAQFVQLLIIHRGLPSSQPRIHGTYLPLLPLHNLKSPAATIFPFCECKVPLPTRCSLAPSTTSPVTIFRTEILQSTSSNAIDVITRASELLKRCVHHVLCVQLSIASLSACFDPQNATDWLITAAHSIRQYVT